MADVAINADTANIPAINFGVQGSDPTAPAAGRCLLYVKSGGVYVRYNGGAATPVGGAATLTTGRLGIGDANGLLSAMALGTEGQLVTANASGLPAWADAPEGSGGGGASLVTLTPFNYSAVTGTALTWANYTTAYGQLYVWNTVGLATDVLTWKADLAAGTYSARLLSHKTTSLGIMDLAIDGSSMGTFDGYAAAPQWNVFTTFTGFVVAASGLKTITLSCPTKNASSSGYTYMFSAISLWRTA